MIWMSIISCQAESVSTRNTDTPSMTSSCTSLMVLYSDGTTIRQATMAIVEQAVATPTMSFFEHWR